MIKRFDRFRFPFLSSITPPPPHPPENPQFAKVGKLIIREKYNEQDERFPSRNPNINQTKRLKVYSQIGPSFRIRFWRTMLFVVLLVCQILFVFIYLHVHLNVQLFMDFLTSFVYLYMYVDIRLSNYFTCLQFKNTNNDYFQ